MNDEREWACSDCGNYQKPRDQEGPYTCAAPSCKHDQLCIGCTFQCSSCEEDHCDRHINFTEAGHVCDVCLKQREGRKAA